MRFSSTILFLLASLLSYGQQVGSSISSNVKRTSVDVPVIPSAPARDYYIDATGVGDGLTAGTPGPPSLLPPAFNRGDHIYFADDDLFFIDDLEIGVDEVTVESFGSGADPVIVGSQSLSATVWTDQGGGLWSTPYTGVKFLYGTDNAPLRNAESAWIPITGTTGALIRRVNPATINAFATSVIGAKVFIKEYDFRMGEELTISAYNSTTGDLTFTGRDIAGGDINMPLKIINMRQFISINGDWAYEGGIIYLKWASDPTGLDLKVATEDRGIFVNNSEGVTIKDLSFRHYFKSCIQATSSPDLTVDNCDFTYGRNEAIRINGPDNNNVTLTNLNITSFASRGISFGGINGGSISSNTLIDINDDANIGRPYDYDRITGGIVQIVADPYYNFTQVRANHNLMIEKNRLDQIGYIAICNWGNDNIIQKNYITNFMKNFSDGGGIYMSYANHLGLNSSTQRNIVQKNILVDGIGSIDGIAGGSHVVNSIGIYFDNGNYGNTATENVVINPGNIGGLFNFWSTNSTVTNNIFIGATLHNVRFREDNSGLYVPEYFDYQFNEHCILTGNIMVSEISACRGVGLVNNNNNATFNPFDDVDNNHYVNPYTGNVAARSQNGSTYTNMGLTAWRTYTGDEGASTIYVNYKPGAAPIADDVRYEINPTDAPVSFNIPVGYTDVYGAAPSNPYSIPAWGALVYLKQ